MILPAEAPIGETFAKYMGYDDVVLESLLEVRVFVFEIRKSLYLFV
jgi:hypothetical protein